MSLLRKIPTLLVVSTTLCYAQPQKQVQKEEYDFNFDGHLDYRVKVMENGKADRYDVYIFDPDTNEYHKDQVLTFSVNPLPYAKKKQVRCFWSGGHGSAIFSATVYGWNGTQFKFSHSERQEAVNIGGRSIYILTKAVLQDGVPLIRSIEFVQDPWNNK
ncbi:hypothetical protein SAMN02745181_2621 [Rubritalea squalenifaciens DSM 18772]|uniref:Uncharacterized protein n=1 Tax=Rubritalea squalenifaciens DSM 18772 TaxID=1123071 RepID=A0A1M6M6K8_9BACT|nr:hypothetical protein [Rubritalea squalenifaciens]SHJ79054.1 hypothetical protein SAMN02745181_2621 [Rubritalea squalenifaciens DSM 18772]